MTLTPDVSIAQSRRTASRTIDGRAVVVVIDEQKLHTLNPVGTYVWDRADGRSIAAIVEDVVREFEVEPDRATADVMQFVEQLVRAGALDVVGRG
ncbi:MAG: PqqD family protein [Sandaracinaceae bacterium]|nr:PqqD family protein [Sandaracinaceae bacterium]